MRLYRIEWSGHCYVVAGSKDRARRDALAEITDPTAVGIDTTTVAVGADEQLGEWSGVTPFGSDTDKTCEQWLKELSGGS